MVQIDAQLSTGLAGLDRVLKGLIPGDNIVWQVDLVEDYQRFVTPFCQSAIDRGKRLIYFHFDHHEPLVTAEFGAEVHLLHPEAGFETFVTETHQLIEASGRGAFVVFDCLSDLAADWYSDQMLGNFFMLTCPHLYDVDAIAYFALQRNNHSFDATQPITETTQVFLDVYRYKGQIYVQPLKVQRRYSPTMYMLHQWADAEFKPVTASAMIAEILNSVPQLRLESTSYRLGIWNRTFLQAEQVMDDTERDECGLDKAGHFLRRLLRMIVSRDDRVLGLCEQYLSLSDLFDIGKRMIGTGLIGGKSVGMLLARAILKRSEPRWHELLEAHDSFYIGSDVFYTYLVRNGIWWMRQKQRDAQSFLEGAELARQRMVMGTFSDHIVKQFEDMLDYFGQSPIIVRSSSLLEDNFGNSFAGKYESVFCVNQGPREKRLEDFISAVRTIYTSAMSVKALTYRAQRAMLDRDEQMGLLVQRVSGVLYGNLFYPQIAGVGFSFNPYVWSPYIDPEAGLLRLVFGLGTRAVDRTDDDYTRVVALNAPERRPESNFDQVSQYAQRKVDTLDLEGNQLTFHDFKDVAQRSAGLPIEMFAARDENLERMARERNLRDVFPWVLTFDRLFAETDFIRDMRTMLRTLQDAYHYPVDVEFTTNFNEGGQYKINLVQCRPLQVQGGGMTTDPPPDLRPEDLVLEAHGAIIGHSRVCDVHRVIYVKPALYGELPIAKRYSVARLIGKLLHVKEPRRPETIMLMGPGRWGTSTPSLGVPVTFADINTITILVEIVAMREDVIPDVSLGTHFFNEIVEMDMLYLALFPSRGENYLNRDFLDDAPNRLLDLLPDAEEWAEIVRVIDGADLPVAGMLKLNANTLEQRALCYVEREAAPVGDDGELSDSTRRRN